MPSIVKILNKKELESAHTGSLMARREKLLKCEESLLLSDRDDGYKVAVGTIEFKDTIEWKNAYAELKDELSRREHWPSNSERKKIRNQIAK